MKLTNVYVIDIDLPKLIIIFVKYLFALVYLYGGHSVSNQPNLDFFSIFTEASQNVTWHR